MKRIKYAIDTETGLTWSRIGDRVAIPVIDTSNGIDLKSDDTEYVLEKFNAKIVDDSDLFKLDWKVKLPLSLKNYHREFWGMKPLKEEKGV